MNERPIEATVIINSADTSVESFASLSRSEKKARLSVVLERGMTAERLTVRLPAGVYGEWVANDSMEIARLQGMGFEVDTKYAPNRALHGSGSGEARVADVIFMTTSMETKELIDEIRADNFVRTHGKPGKKTPLKEETEFATKAAGDGIRVINESDASSVNAEELRAALFQTGS